MLIPKVPCQAREADRRSWRAHLVASITLPQSAMHSALAAPRFTECRERLPKPCGVVPATGPNYEYAMQTGGHMCDRRRAGRGGARGWGSSIRDEVAGVPCMCLQWSREKANVLCTTNLHTHTHRIPSPPCRTHTFRMGAPFRRR